MRFGSLLNKEFTYSLNYLLILDCIGIQTNNRITEDIGVNLFVFIAEKWLTSATDEDDDVDDDDNG